MQLGVGEQMQTAARFGHRFDDIRPLGAKRNLPLMQVGPTDDTYEQQADRMAGRIMGDLHGISDTQAERESIMPLKAGSSVAPIQRYNAGASQQGGMASPDMSAQTHNNTAAGEPVPGPLRRSAERVLNRGLGHLRIHTDRQADDLSQHLHADAFTAGFHAFIRAEKYKPNSFEGQWLLAHEIAHAVQQEGSHFDQNASVLQRNDGVDVNKRMRRYYPGRGRTYSQISDDEENIDVRNFPMMRRDAGTYDESWRTTGQGDGQTVGSAGASSCRIRLAADTANRQTWVQHKTASDPGTNPPFSANRDLTVRGTHYPFGADGAAITPDGHVFLENVQGSLGSLDPSHEFRKRIYTHNQPMPGHQEFNWHNRDFALQAVHNELMATRDQESESGSESESDSEGSYEEWDLP